jgi:hypothetical protein
MNHSQDHFIDHDKEDLRRLDAKNLQKAFTWSPKKSPFSYERIDSALSPNKSRHFFDETSRTHPSEEMSSSTRNTLLDLKQKKEKKIVSVSFDKVSIRFYNRAIASNPSCSSGPPIGLGWEYEEERHYRLDTFERHRIDNRRCLGQLLLSRSCRAKLLMDWGYSQKDIVNAVRHTIRFKNQRCQTITNLRAASLEETLESARDGVKKILLGLN